jgi:glyoxylase-like metal-dependent hydrolase (beta-lactamase superfamily II)
MVESLRRLRVMEPTLRVFPGHGRDTTIERERAWLDLVDERGALLV